MISKKTAIDLGVFVVSNVMLWYGVKWLIAQMDPMRKKKEESAEQAKLIFERLGKEKMELSDYEQIIASEIVHPEDIDVKFEDIGGLGNVIDALREAVIYPLTMPHLFQQGNQLLGPPKGAALWATRLWYMHTFRCLAPTCNRFWDFIGKTMVAKALAKESGATFINLHVSTLTEKWFGESQKLVRALFSLARKVQPAIIFIDEIDSFLRERQSSDHEVTGMMKAEFMSLWDGMASSSSDRVMILGATNRYNDIDKAILRRMPKRFPISLPDEGQRARILEIMLKETEVKGNRKKFIKELSGATVGFSGSDLKELCRNAVMLPVREYLREQTQQTKGDLSKVDTSKHRPRPLSLTDFLEATKQDGSDVQRMVD